MQSTNLKSTVGIALFFTLGFLVTVSCKKEKSVFAVADFSFSGNISALPATVQFTNKSIGLSYTWDFGDGSTSTAENPSHTYTQFGLYKVKLTAQGTNNVDSMVLDIVIGGTLGQITALNCNAAQINRTIKTGDVLNQHPILVPYTGSNGGVYNGQSIASTGVTGLTATLTAGTLANGAGNLEYKLTGTPQSFGQAKFNLSIGGRSCELSIPVLDSGDYIPRNGLIGWWPFNGNANDESGNANNGVVNGAVLTTDRFDINARAYRFDGINDFIEIAHNQTLNSGSVSISVWFKPNGFLASNPHLLSKREQSGWGNSFQMNVGVTQGQNACWADWSIGGNGGIYLLSSTVLKNNSWFHLVYTHDNNNVKMFLDGNLVQSIASPGLLTFNTLPLWFGARPNASFNSQWYNGKLDDVGIWNRALTPLEIQALYLGGE